VNFQLYDTASKSIVDFVPGDPSHVTFYTCGPTVYDDAHIGNFRSFLAADLLRRWLESPLCTLSDGQGGSHAGPRKVTHVMNITDVGHMTDDADADGGGEDKMLAAERRILEAKKAGTIPADAKVDAGDPFAVAEFYMARFLEDARALGLKVAAEAEHDPSVMPRATGHVEGMKRVITELLQRGFAYTAGTPGARAVYFDVQKSGGYGRLSGNTLDHLRGGAGGRIDVRNQQEKHHPADFLLWKEDASHKMKWSAPEHDQCKGWGEGYPGWHIECTAMSLDRLVPGGLQAALHKHAEIDLHSGGEDNIFPHHECEIAQSCAFTGAPRFARHWFHPRFLMVDGAKMSKSKGTFYTPRELIGRVIDGVRIDESAVRLELIKSHYRANADFSLQGLKHSASRIERWRELASALHRAVQQQQNSPVPVFNQWAHKFVVAMTADLNIAGALSAIDIAKNALNIDLGPHHQPSFPHDLNGKRFAIPSEPLDQVDIDDMIASGDSAKVHLAKLHQIDRILGVIFSPDKSQDTGIAVYLPGVSPSAEVETLLTERRDAKKAKDFARSDAIRDQLAGMGYAVKDVAGGKVEVGPA
jgi:cysteinyl-tRNA synthetase